MILIQKLSRTAVYLVATVITIITGTIVANAFQRISIPNAAQVPYNLGPGLSTGCFIDVPSNVPVSVMGCCTSLNVRSVGQVTLLKIPALAILWVGLESVPGAAITQGNSGADGTHIVYIDWSHQVDIEVCNNPLSALRPSIKVHNASGGTRAGAVTLIW